MLSRRLLNQTKMTPNEMFDMVDVLVLHRQSNPDDWEKAEELFKALWHDGPRMWLREVIPPDLGSFKKQFDWVDSSEKWHHSLSWSTIHELIDEPFRVRKNLSYAIDFKERDAARGDGYIPVAIKIQWTGILPPIGEETGTLVVGLTGLRGEVGAERDWDELLKSEFDNPACIHREFIPLPPELWSDAVYLGEKDAPVTCRLKVTIPGGKTGARARSQTFEGSEIPLGDSSDRALARVGFAVTPPSAHSDERSAEAESAHKFLNSIRANSKPVTIEITANFPYPYFETFFPIKFADNILAGKLVVTLKPPAGIALEEVRKDLFFPGSAEPEKISKPNDGTEESR
ncbi:MAG: hypothetical protein AAF658_20525, partial [Myxococcota bacterium]